jgi:hypothetical protein
VRYLEPSVVVEGRTAIGAVVLAVLSGHHDRMENREIVGLIVGLVGVGVLLGLDVGRGDLGSAEADPAGR